MTDTHGSAPGFYSYHANRLEDLRAILVKICSTDPLPPLHADMCLVQSNGIAQWVKLGLSQAPSQGGLGIAAGIDFSLPAGFIWQAYRAFLPAEAVPAQSPLDKDTLVWRIYRLLDTLLDDPKFSALKRFLAGSNADLRRYQLAERLSMLYDQYQMYRADWLKDWEHNNDVLKGVNSTKALDQENLWQASLWRLLIKDVGDALANTSRASIHSQFMELADKASAPLNPQLLPRRIFVFGISALPKQILEALRLLSKFTQVVFCVANPCQYYWGDIVSERDMIRRGASAQSQKQQQFLAQVSAQEMHNHANPLLASLGKQGRDYIRLLEQYDGTRDDGNAAYVAHRHDVFYPYGDESDGQAQGILQEIQNDIFHLTPINEILEQNRLLSKPDLYTASIAFHEVHTEQRELEVLHDQLLDAFNTDPNLVPSDILVMTPDINKYAPHINAVFALHESKDPRSIPFTISDQGLRNIDPNVIAFETLMSLPQKRFTYTEIISLLELPAISEAFGFERQDIEVVKVWIRATNVRWGINDKHRSEFVAIEDDDVSTWQASLRAMLLGYSMEDGASWANVAAFGEIGGLEASLVGNLAEFINALDQFRTLLQEPVSPSAWQGLIQQLTETFFADNDLHTTAIKAQLNKHAARLVANADAASSNEIQLPASTVAEFILKALEGGTLNHRFLMGRVNFATLMPMRAIPFKRIYLLGMNDNAFPRSKKAVDFDLMAGDYRPGDRSLREDDRYLFLEALLAARKSLYISWVGRSVIDDAERPPSILVSQLKDYIDKFWKLKNSQQSVSEQLTRIHPLQAFSERYFAAPAVHLENAGDHKSSGADLFTYASYWRDVTLAINSGQEQQKPETSPLPFTMPETSVNIYSLTRFMKDPVTYFFNHALHIRFEDNIESVQDDETFALSPLLLSQLESAFIERAILPSDNIETLHENIVSCAQSLKASGELGLASIATLNSETLAADMKILGERYHDHVSNFIRLSDTKVDIANVMLTHEQSELLIEDQISGFWTQDTNPNADLYRIDIARSKTSKIIQNKVIRYFDALIPYWLTHLLGHLAGSVFTTQVLAKERDCYYQFKPLDKAKAQQIFTDFVSLWQQNMTEPLFVDARGACAFSQAFLENENAPDLKTPTAVIEARLSYQNLYFSRAFGQGIDADTMLQSQAFQAVARSLYVPMIEQVSVVEGA